jgi:Polyketide cyclase / dehydrase and lipid transport
MCAWSVTRQFVFASLPKGALAWLLVGLAGASTAQPIDVSVRTLGPKVVVDVTAHVVATREVVWAVVTDYDHMAEFMTTLKSSTVVSRQGNLLEVAQTGEAKRGFLHFSFSTVRAVELTPAREIRSYLIKGDFKSYEFTTRLDDGAPGGIAIVHHGEYVPTTWVPPVIGPAMIESETRKQYTQLIVEILRRQAGEHRAPSER